jgi:type IV pilus assembly protein PilC
MATATSTPRAHKEFVYEWEGKDRNGKQVRGELRAAGANQVQATLRRQGVLLTKVKKRRMRSGKTIKPKDIAIFTRQLATMMPACRCCKLSTSSVAATPTRASPSC